MSYAIKDSNGNLKPITIFSGKLPEKMESDITRVPGVLTENQLLTLISGDDGVYVIKTELYGYEVLIVNKSLSLYKRITGNFDFVWDIDLLKWNPTINKTKEILNVPQWASRINSSMFSNNQNISQIIFTSDVHIDPYSFFNCKNVTTVEGGQHILNIDEGSFAECTSLTNITLNNNITNIGVSAFVNCTSLVSITLPNNLTNISKYAFRGCTKLINILIPNSVTSIGIDAFRECSSLTSITIPNSITTVEFSTFYGCSSLTSITIPNSVTRIGSQALNIGSTTNKATIVFKGTVPPTIATFTFNDTKLNKIYVPASAVEAYKTATNWTRWASFIEANPNG